ncbi:cytochrome c3 family protein [Crateriforma conspicua]|uniref:Tetratricopeptide repeat protein n=1 Tax=Crateriforma conspicua TaxID=2527996 RepID=A0A5C6FQ65_9PLAN|nr:cytochrome c3 family protein [Crateriforma conspicua]TWU63434.1 Tetratricopeptide repeat protein [Crateriforma conspicua]
MSQRRSKRPHRKSAGTDGVDRTTSVNRQQGETRSRRPWIVVGVGLLALFATLGWWFGLFGVSDRQVMHWQATLSVPPVDSGSAPTLVKLQDKPPGHIGIENCRGCHQDKYDSFVKTAHFQSFTMADRLAKLPEASVVHQPTSRTYSVENDGDAQWHVETLLDPEGEPISQTRRRMDFAFGSGIHGITPAYEVDGWMMQSPLTWYAEGVGWAMSPGYEGNAHQAFERLIVKECVFCHVGQAQPDPQNELRFRVSEMRISCERCHGGGQSHAEVMTALDEGRDTDVEDTIVNPANLSRDAAEAVCQQCHLQAAMYVNATGQDVWDYRPGETLVANRTDFAIAGDGSHRIVNHVEQLHDSRCYIESETMTCVTCHDPHHRESPTERVALYREACFQCHSNESCGVDLAVRQDRNRNDCSDCHMPSLPTRDVHAALHHHTIGVFDDQGRPRQNKQSGPEGGLNAILNQDTLSKAEIDRRRAIATIELSVNDPAFQPAQDVLVDASTTLMQAVGEGKADRRMRNALMLLADQMEQSPVAQQMARTLIDEPDNDALRSIALEILGTEAFKAGDNATALDAFERLVKLRQRSNDYYILALCLRNAGDDDGSIQAAETALRLSPDFIAAHELLAFYFQDNDPEKAEAHLNAAETLGRIQTTSH